MTTSESSPGNACWKAGLLLLIVVFYLGVGVFDHDIWAPTEPTVAGIVWEMHSTGDLAVPRIGGHPYLEKPPLYYWMALGCCKVGGGMSAWAMRLPAALMGLACLGILFSLARRRYGERVAWLTVLLGATTLSFYEMSHRASTDVAAMFFAVLCLGLFARSIGSSQRRWDWLFALALGFSFYCKNFYTFLVVLPPVFLFLAYRREFRRAAALGLLVAAFTALLVLPWAVALYHRGGAEYLRVVFVDNTVGRFFHLSHQGLSLGPLNDAYTAEKAHPWWEYLPGMGILVMPWPLLFLAGLWRAAREWKREGDFERFLVVTVIVIPLALSLSSSKVLEYLGPVILVTALLMGNFLARLLSGDGARWERIAVGVNVWVVIAAAALAPFAAAIVVSRPAMLVWAAVAAGALWAGRRLAWKTNFATLCAALAFIVAALAFSVAGIMPYADGEKENHSFFDAIRADSARRDLYTISLNDHHLPLIIYYMRRQPKILRDQEAVFTLLRGQQEAGIIVPRSFYRRRQADFAAVPHRVIETPQGRPVFVYVTNARE